MAQNEIIILVLTSSVLSAFLTILFQWLFKFVDYRLDYKKKIIDKRIIAYENIDIITWQLGFITQNGNMVWSGIFTSENDFDNFIINLTLARKNQIWLSKELIEKLQQLNVFLINLQNTEKPQNEEDYNILGNRNYEKIRLFRKEIEKIYKTDFSKLDKVDVFLNDKTHSTNKYKIYSKK